MDLRARAGGCPRPVEVPSRGEEAMLTKNRIVAFLLLTLAACARPEEDAAAFATIGAGGGTLRFGDGTSVEVPAAARARDSEIVIRRQSETAGTGASVSAVGPVYELLPDGT